MKAFFTLLLLALAPAALGEQVYWNQFRGPTGNGVSTAKNLPVEFDEAKNVRWKTTIPFEGWSSPVVWGNEIWLTTGSDQKKELRAICVDLDSGKIVKDIKVFDMVERKVDPAYKHDSPHLNSSATPTPVVEQVRVFVHFGSQGIACLDRKTGNKIWERRDLRIYQPVRQGSSPIVDDKSLYVAYDGTDQQFFVALDKATGVTRWKQDRNIHTDWGATLRSRGLSPKKGGGGKPGDNKKSFATATLIEVNGRRQLIAPAAEATISYDPQSGKELWRVLHPGGFNVSARPLFAHGLVYVFTSGLTGHFLAIKADGSGDVTDTHVAWSTTKGTPRIPSPVIVNDLLFTVTDKFGIVRCLDAKSGQGRWKQRIGGDHWASPLFADGKLYFCSKQGDVTVINSSRDKPTILARNKLKARFIASPAVSGESLILRSTTHLYCLANGYQRTAKQVAADTYPQRNGRDGKNTAGAKNSAGLDELAARLKAAVKSGKMTAEEATAAYKKAVARQKQSGAKGKSAAKSKIDLEEAYQRLLKTNPAVKKKIDSGGATKEQVIEWLKKTRLGKGGAGKGKGKGKGKTAAGVTNFYAIVIGRLKSKDVELGEFTFAVDHVTSMYSNRWVKDEIVGKTVKVTGVSGSFRDKLLLIKRGQTLKVRSGSYAADSKTLHFGPKFHVLEPAKPFKPEDFGVPPKDFRGFRGVLQGKIVEAGGYEVLMTVDRVVKVADGSKAANAKSIEGKRIRVVGFYNQHRKAFEDLHVGDTIRVSTTHANPNYDEFRVTDTLKKLEK